MMGSTMRCSARGPLTMAPSQLGFFTRSEPVATNAPTSSSTCSRCRSTVRRAAAHFPAFTTSVCNLQPTSRGHMSGCASPIRRRAGRSSRTISSADEDRKGRGRFDPRRAPHHGAAGAQSRLPARWNICRAPNVAATTMPRSRRPPAISAPPSSIRSAPRRWACPATRSAVVDERLRVIGSMGCA
jgi:hypothetical protein